MTLSSVLMSFTRSSPTLTTPPSSGAVSTKCFVFRLLFHPLCLFVFTALGLWTNNPSSHSLVLLHPELPNGPSCHVNGTAERTMSCFPRGWEVFLTHMVLTSICICLIIFLIFKDLKHQVMVGVCHPVLFLLISACDLCVHCTKY